MDGERWAWKMCIEHCTIVRCANASTEILLSLTMKRDIVREIIHQKVIHIKIYDENADPLTCFIAKLLKVAHKCGVPCGLWGQWRQWRYLKLQLQ